MMKFERISELLLSTDYLDTGFEPEKHLTEKYIPLLKIDKYTYYILILLTSNVTYSTKNIYIYCSDILTLDRFCKDKFIELVPAIDLEPKTALSNNEGTASIIRKQLLNVLSCFDKPR